MKKSLLAVFISSILVLSACDDKALVQKVSQLETELKQSQAELSKKSEEVAVLTNEATALKSKLDKDQQTFPALQVDIVKLFDRSETLKFPKDPNDEYPREESSVAVFASTAHTQVEWINRLLLQGIALNYLDEDEASKAQDKVFTQEDVQKLVEKRYTDYIAQAKEEKPIGFSDSIETLYLGQRNNIVSFSRMYQSYMGGAHGMYYREYINMDIRKQAIIGLDDLMSPTNQAKLRDALWNDYINSRTYEQGEQPYANKEDFRISDSFYFTPNGITFVYPPYELGPFAEGEIELNAYFSQINEWLNSDYRLTEKDGFGLSQSEFF